MRDGVPAGFERHKMPSSHIWCPNGTQPAKKITPKKGVRTHRGKSVRTVSGGLPTLGDRN